MARVAQSDAVPFAVQEALVEVAGKCFWYRDPLRHVLVRAGVPPPLVAKYSDLSKYQLMRAVLVELDERGAAGAAVQRQLVRELVGLRTFGDDVDTDLARGCVRQLTAVAGEYGLLDDLAKQRRADVPNAAQRQAARDRLKKTVERTATLSELRVEFGQLAGADTDRQRRGYRREALIGELAKLQGLGYTPPFRKGTVIQIDGHFHFDSHHYLIESRWRERPPDYAALSAFSAKVANGLIGTRGLFVSIPGFRAEAVEEIERGVRNIVLMSGSELALILEDRPSFLEAMELKVVEASRRGRLFHDVALSTR
jgi:restriction endonuclease